MKVRSTRTSGRDRRTLSLAAATAFAVAAGSAVLFGYSGSAAADPMDECTATSGAVVAVDFGPWGGGIVGGCDAHPPTGMNLLHNAGFSTATLAHDVTTPQPGGRTPDLAKGSGYLTAPARLLDGHYYEAFPDSGFADFGLTIDAAFALAATGTDDPALRRIADFLDGRGTDGSGRTADDWTGIGSEYAGGGSIGKEALLAEVVGRDPHRFGGQDLIAALAKTVCAAPSPAPDTSCAAAGNYTYATSVFSQALGIMAQLRAGDTAAAAGPVGYLKGLQHPDGSWPSLIPATGDSDVDSTAMAAMALALLTDDPAAQQAVDRAAAWIAGRQLADGGFPGAAGDSTNSAALAVQGLSLRAASYGAAIARARDFLTGQQNADGGFNVAAGGQQGSDVRASTQALGGTVGTSFGTLSRPLGGTQPTGSPSPTASPTATTSPTATGSPTATASPTATTSPTATASPTATTSPTATASPTATTSPTATASPSATASPTGTGTATPTGTIPTGTPPESAPPAGGAPAPGRTDNRPGPGDSTAYPAVPVRLDVPVPSGSGLASTGTEVEPIALTALALLLAGGAAVAYARRTRSSAGRHR
ncbi:prenyltransferase/squalene oxidase repeat-containing protein [Kitasatospora sp. NPDC058170]|uniref:prenyltransferase/squalene oxidase repeat-containing protein n=1 Tax=Kitasatospora sp. NPDC058170 TaxID=3346364 RepID=UPI0036DD860A